MASLTPTFRPAVILTLALIGGASLWPPAARGDGAVALAKPQDIAQGGWSIGLSWNFRSSNEATRRALTECRTTKEPSEETKKLCRIVTTFRNQCAAVAQIEEFQGSSPIDDVGFGWAVADTKQGAGEQAIAMCRRTDRQGNARLCKVTLEGCDGSAR